MVQTLETTSGRKWTENTENVAKRLNAQYAVAEKEGWAEAGLCSRILHSAQLLSPLHCTLPLPQPLCQGLWTGVDNGGPMGMRMKTFVFRFNVRHSSCGIESIAAELGKKRGS